MELLRSKGAPSHVIRAFSAAVLLIAVICLCYPSLNYDYYSSLISISFQTETAPELKDSECDIFSGEWIPDPDAPYYTNFSCPVIHEYQNCMKNGRPDSEFMKWRWKPYGCDLPNFDPAKFLEMMAGKSMALIGDSVARNHMQSMICLMGRVEYPIDVSTSPDEKFKKWRYENHNFTLQLYWSPFLIRSELGPGDHPLKPAISDLYLDEPDPVWASDIDKFDYLILNTGQWFPRPAMYYLHREVVGCRLCKDPNVTELPCIFAYRHGIETALSAIEKTEGFKGLTFLRSLSPSHFEGGQWNEGGNCLRKKPYLKNETVMEGMNLEFRDAQFDILTAAQRRGKKEFRLMDLTYAMFMRPDGHPSGYWPSAKMPTYKDCVHWCLPGPIDTWADFLMHMFKVEARKNLPIK